MIDIVCNYAGGNIKTVALEAGRVLLEQDLRDTSGWWFYWNFSAQAAAGQTVLFQFVNGEVVGPWGPAVSYDGVEWAWLGKNSLRSRDSFIYTFREGQQRVFFSFCLPYQMHHFERFYSRIARHRAVSRQILTVSEQLRAIPYLQIGCSEAERHIIFTARHHACESTPSYVLEGVIDYLLQAERSPLLDRCLVHYIPFMDIDGVEGGDQGKGRAPHDHNRDYTDTPMYSSTAELMAIAADRQFDIALDFHDPFKWEGRNDVPFFVKQPSPIKEEIERLGGFLQQICSEHQDAAAIRYCSANDLESGEDWNIPHGRACSNFFWRHGARLACSLEFPYFGTEEAAVTADNSRRFGHSLGRALERYINET
ncbi:M14 family zinc carboxypeptidase [Paenibacillus sp. GCM10027626]|uniref:M14 family zinc carboxypeptidase n=1 Tax=Paenibacillus sp. GCM10027626 TaxID=3273411 RepID=UPI003644515F